MSWLAKARLTGDGPRFVKVGRPVRYLESCVKEYIKARTRGSTGEEWSIVHLKSPERTSITIHDYDSRRIRKK